jgi:hypothetical protein
VRKYSFISATPETAMTRSGTSSCSQNLLKLGPYLNTTQNGR